MIYIYCPKNVVTGGPDALHQLHYYLNKIKIRSKIVYVDINKKIDIHALTPLRYECYCDESSVLREDIEIDKEHNIVILPELYNDLSFEFKNSKVIVWWLSVLNWTKSSSLHDTPFLKKIFRIFKKAFYRDLSKQDFKIRTDITHWAASYFALDFLKTMGVNNTYKVIEPISLQYLNNLDETSEYRHNKIIYNPSRAKKTMKKIIKANKDIDFIPLKGYNIDELTDLYRTNKLYLDLGEFPGAERIPKEAVINGMCLLVGRGGASNFYKDVPIPDFYKIGDKNDMFILRKKIDYIFQNFEKTRNDFYEYKNVVLNLERNFMNQLTIFFEDIE